MGVQPVRHHRPAWIRPQILLLAAATVASSALLLDLRSRVGFLLDDWAFVIYRQDVAVGSLLDPHNEHIVAIPVVI